MTPDERRRRFEEFAVEWTPKVRNIAYRSGFTGSDLEDCVQEVITFLFEKDYLSRYDPERGKLTTFMYGLSLVRVLDYKRKLGKRSGGEFTASEVFDADTNGALRDTHVEGRMEAVEIRTALAETYAWLSQLPEPSGQALARLFSDIVQQVMETGKVSYREIARQRGLSRKAMADQTQALMRSGAMEALRLTLKETDAPALAR